MKFIDVPAYRNQRRIMKTPAKTLHICNIIAFEINHGNAFKMSILQDYLGICHIIAFEIRTILLPMRLEPYKIIEGYDILLPMRFEHY